MKLFLDSSVLLAAGGSAVGASRLVFELAAVNYWKLFACPYVEGEVSKNLAKSGGLADWPALRHKLHLTADQWTLDRIVVFPVRKDRPVLFTAYGCADVLLTLDRADFMAVLGRSFYHLRILTPGDFIRQEREAGRLKVGR